MWRNFRPSLGELLDVKINALQASTAGDLAAEVTERRS